MNSQLHGRQTPPKEKSVDYLLAWQTHERGDWDIRLRGRTGGPTGGTLWHVVTLHDVATCRCARQGSSQCSICYACFHPFFVRGMYAYLRREYQELRNHYVTAHESCVVYGTYIWECTISRFTRFCRTPLQSQTTRKPHHQGEIELVFVIVDFHYYAVSEAY